MATTIAVSDNVRRKLMILKQESGAKSMDELLERMLVEHRRLRLLEIGTDIRQRMEQRGLSLEDVLRKERKR